MPRPLLLALLVLVFAGCRPAAQVPSTADSAATALLAPTDNPHLENAERVAREFLEAWKGGDFATMHSLLTFSAQDATPSDEFTQLYQSSQSEMTLQSLDYQGNTLGMDGDVAVFNYSVTFHTRVLGDIADNNRNLHLVNDEKAADWRVAWSPGDIFAQMDNGGELRLKPIIPPRANIYDRTGLTTLADMNGRVVTVSVSRESVPDYPGCLSALAQAFDSNTAVQQAAIEAHPPNWLLDMGTLEPDQWEQYHTQLENTCAATFTGFSVRHYNNGTVASNLIGFVGYPDEADVPALLADGFEQNSIIGKSGIEASWDETLRGRPGGELSIVTSSGETIREVKSQRSTPPESLWLTIDVGLQAHIEQIVADAYAKNADTWGKTSQGASVVVQDIHTGEILAMVSYPTFDNNVFTPFPEMGQTAADTAIQAIQNDPRKPQLNRPALGAYPLGSVMKLVSSTAVANSGVYTLDQRFTCNGLWSRDIVRHDWLAGGHGTLTLPQAITQSCDPYFYEVGYRLDSVNPFLLPNYARNFGFGSPTGIHDVAEAHGQIVDPDWWRTNIGTPWNFSESVNMSIGQGYLDVTPLQVVGMISTIANGGTVYRPHLVKQAGLIGETPGYTATAEVVRQLDVRPEVIAVVKKGMCDVTTNPLGTAQFIFRDDSRLQAVGVCGKTGTAEAPPNPEPHAWFGAYAPRENPEIAVVVMVENSGEGSYVAAPIAKAVFDYYFFGPPPGQAGTPNQTAVPGETDTPLPPGLGD